MGLDFAGEDLHWWDGWMERQSRSSSSHIRFILIKVEMFSSVCPQTTKKHPKSTPNVPEKAKVPFKEALVD